MGCPSGKRCYLSKELAEEALIQNHIHHLHRPGSGPLNVYECPDCREWHFTSGGSKNKIFDDPSIKERIEKGRRELEWKNRF